MTQGKTQVVIGMVAFAVTIFVALGVGAAPASEAAQRSAPARAESAIRPVAAMSAPAALTGVRSGLWTVRAEGLAPQRLCLGDPVALVQLRHGDAQCTRMVVAADARAATVQYSCPGAGWGRTIVTVDSAEAVRIDTQGIAGNAPFAYQAEARREGDCATGDIGRAR